MDDTSPKLLRWPLLITPPQHEEQLKHCKIEEERERNGDEKTQRERDESRGCAAFIRCVVTCVAASIYQPHFGGSNHILKCMTCIFSVSGPGVFQRTPIHCLPVRQRRVPTATAWHWAMSEEEQGANDDPQVQIRCKRRRRRHQHHNNTSLYLSWQAFIVFYECKAQCYLVLPLVVVVDSDNSTVSRVSFLFDLVLVKLKQQKLNRRGAEKWDNTFRKRRTNERSRTRSQLNFKSYQKSGIDWPATPLRCRRAAGKTY